MAVVRRYTAELVRAFVAAGYWTPLYPVDFWRRNACDRGEEVALVAPDGRYTWKEAAATIDLLAAGLMADGWQRDEVLILQAPNSAELLFLRLACEVAGVITALVPITFSRAEIETIVRQLAPRGVALPAGARGVELIRFYEALGRRYTIGGPVLPDARPLPASPVTAVPVNGFAPYEYAAIVTTSGTTGTPKCVEHTACARLAAGREYVRRLHITAADVMCGFTSFFAGNCDLMIHHAAPQAGAKVVLLDVFSPEAACALIERERVTCAVFVPTLLHRLLSYPQLPDYDLSSLRLITSFGAMLAPEVAQQAEERLGVRVIQGYGASEYGALASTAYDDLPEVRRRGIGRPLTGTEIQIRDENGREVPVGRTGRIFARGPHCVGGYVNDWDATAEAWTDGFLAMGDLGRLDDEGYLWLEGRARDVIIRGGQNISPLEIENALLCHPDVHDVAAVRMADAEMGERVCVFVVPVNGSNPNLTILCDFMLQRGLARFKLPERLELIEALPMNPAGTKVNKRALEARLATAA